MGINIAIDGPAGAGKSTIAKIIAKQLNYIYIDTGAMYRALTWKVLRDQIPINSEQQVLQTLKGMNIVLNTNLEQQRILVDDHDVSEDIRSREVANYVSHIASYPTVREEMLNLQRLLAMKKGVVMDGRDIGTHVLPDAELKIFLSASIKERAERRYLELLEKSEKVTLAEIEEEIRTRDERDMQRKVAPLRKASDAIEIDTTGLSIAEVVEKVLNLVDQKIN